MANSLEHVSTGAQAELASDFDVVFVGAGVSSSYTLLSMLDGLRQTPRNGVVRVAVIEQAPDVYGGQAYGLRSGYTSLLITSLRDFLPEAPRALFTTWLSKNKNWAFDRFRAAGGELSARWWAQNVSAVEDDLWDDLYLPRYLFGLYMAETVNDAVSDAEAAGLIRYTLIQEEVSAVEQRGHVYAVTGRASATSWHSRYVVLAVGSGPTVPRFGGGGGSGSADLDTVALIEDLYLPSVGGNVERINDAIRRSGDRKINVLIIGGNASTMEALYVLNDTAIPGLKGADFFVLSPSATLPERLVDPTPATCFVPENLLELQNEEDLTAESVYRAALRDLEAAKGAGLSITDTLAPISRAVVSVVKLLSRDQQLEFAGHWGAELGRHQRRAGNEYTDVVAALNAQGRLQHVAGKFVEINKVDTAGASFVYEVNGETREFEQRMTVVVNCSGFCPLHEVDEDSLLDNLVRSGTCRPTKWSRGLVVNDDMEANDGLFVMGPLLAGNVVSDFPIWHVEHCGRISAYSATLGKTLVSRLAADSR